MKAKELCRFIKSFNPFEIMWMLCVAWLPDLRNYNLGVYGPYVMLITVLAMLINTVYGFAKWLIYIKQKKNGILSSPGKA